MKQFISYIFLVIFLMLMVVNVFVFMSGIRLSDEISKYDKETLVLKKENTELEKQVYEISSLQHAASVSAQLDFSQEAKPMYFSSLKYALNRQ